MTKPHQSLSIILVLLNIVLSNVCFSQLPAGYTQKWRDDFDTFNAANWSRGLVSDIDSNARLLWNKTTGGKNLLNDKYCGYIMDDDSYVTDGVMNLRNQKRNITGTDPVGNFSYTSGWVNSLRKLYFNGTKKGIYLEIKAKFPVGEKVWPAIWLVTESRVWPPEVDILEYFGNFFNYNKLDVMYLRNIYGSWQSNTDMKVEIRNFNKTYTITNWHVYGFLWTDQLMQLSIDGNVIATINRDVSLTGSWPDENMALVMNNGAMTVAADKNTTWPNTLYVDYIALYENNMTGLDVNKKPEEFEVYRNNENKICIHPQVNQEKMYWLDVYNISGQLIVSQYLKNDMLDTNHIFKNGIYLVNLFYQNKLISKKLLFD